MTSWLVWILMPIFGVAAVLAVLRIVRGPSVLDRVVAADVLVATLICALGAEMAINHHTFTLPVALILAVFAVFGSISVAKFMADQDDTPDVGAAALAPDVGAAETVDVPEGGETAPRVEGDQKS